MKTKITKDQFYRYGGFSNPRLFRTSHSVYDANGHVIDCIWQYWQRN